MGRGAEPTGSAPGLADRRATPVGPGAGTSTAPSADNGPARPLGLYFVVAVLVVLLAGAGIWIGTAPSTESDRAAPGPVVQLENPEPITPITPGTITAPPTGVVPDSPPRSGAPADDASPRRTRPAASPTRPRTSPARPPANAPPPRSQPPPSGPYVSTSATVSCFDGGWNVQATARLHNVGSGTKAYGHVEVPVGDLIYSTVMVGTSTSFEGTSWDLKPGVAKTTWWVLVEISDGREIRSATKTAQRPC